MAKPRVEDIIATKLGVNRGRVWKKIDEIVGDSSHSGEAVRRIKETVEVQMSIPTLRNMIARGQEKKHVGQKWNLARIASLTRGRPRLNVAE